MRPTSSPRMPAGRAGWGVGVAAAPGWSPQRVPWWPAARRMPTAAASAPPGVWFQFEHIGSKPPVLGGEGSRLAGAGLDHAGWQELPTGCRRTDLLPLLGGALVRIGGPGGQHCGGQVSAPLRRPQRPPGRLLGHAHDTVVDLDALGRGSRPAQASQGHPRIGRQCAAPGVHATGQPVHISRVPVPGHQRVDHATDEVDSPSDALGQHSAGQELAGLLFHTVFERRRSAPRRGGQGGNDDEGVREVARWKVA
jgi:hypothetical protein